MNFFIIINKLYFSLLIIFPFFSLSQNYVDDIYYGDDEVNYNFLDRPYNNLTFQLFNSFLDYNSSYGFRKYDFKLNTNYLKIYFKSIIHSILNN